MANPSVQLQLSQSDTTERCSNSEIMQDWSPRWQVYVSGV